MKKIVAFSVTGIIIAGVVLVGFLGMRIINIEPRPPVTDIIISNVPEDEQGRRIQWEGISWHGVFRLEWDILPENADSTAVTIHSTSHVIGVHIDYFIPSHGFAYIMFLQPILGSDWENVGITVMSSSNTSATDSVTFQVPPLT